MSEPATRRFFFFGRGKNTPDPIVCQFVYIGFFFPQKTKQKKENTLLGGSTVFKFGGFTPKGIICNFISFVVAWLCDLAF